MKIYILWRIDKTAGRGLFSIHSNYDSALTTLRLQVEGGRVNEKPRGRPPMNEIGYGVLQIAGERADGTMYQVTSHTVEG